MALVVANETTTFVLLWARISGSNQKPADKINNVKIRHFMNASAFASHILAARRRVPVLSPFRLR